jgi:hypothetical protein
VTEPTEEDPNVDPDWAFSEDQNIRCPDCDALLVGLNWKFNTLGLMEDMALVPCGHVLDGAVWELTFTGRDRRIGTVIRTPKFVRKTG